MKLTAQFVARNGRLFLANLTQREHRNPMFDFLQPHSTRFAYFHALVENYKRVLAPPTDLVERLRVEAADRSARVGKGVVCKEVEGGRRGRGTRCEKG